MEWFRASNDWLPREQLFQNGESSKDLHCHQTERQVLDTASDVSEHCACRSGLRFYSDALGGDGMLEIAYVKV